MRQRQPASTHWPPFDVINGRFCDAYLEEQFDGPLFRLASVDEIREKDLKIPQGSTAFCIVTSHGSGPDGPRVFVVARSARMLAAINA